MALLGGWALTLEVNRYLVREEGGQILPYIACDWRDEEIVQNNIVRIMNETSIL
jgi:hypothetical protein